MTRIGFIISQIAVLFLTVSCSSSEDFNETGVIKETQDRIAQEAIDYIKGPINQAKTASKLANEHNRQIEKAQQAE